MDFPLGSLVVILVFILLASGIIDLVEHRFKFMVYGLATILLGSFLIIPLPAPKGLNITLNCGEAIIPVVMAMFLWAKAPVEDKYRASLGTLAIGLTLYGLSSLLNLEPGLVKYPLLFSVPITVLIAFITGKSMLASALAIVSGCTLVSILRLLEVVFTPDAVVTMDLPDALTWNTLSLGTVADLTTLWVVDLVEGRYKEWVKSRDLGNVPIGEELEPELVVLAEECEQEDSQFVNPEQ